MKKLMCKNLTVLIEQIGVRQDVLAGDDVAALKMFQSASTTRRFRNVTACHDQESVLRIRRLIAKDIVCLLDSLLKLLQDVVWRDGEFRPVGRYTEQVTAVWSD